MEEVVIKSFNGIGDLLFVTPTLSKLKTKFPDVHLIVNTNHPIMLKNNPYVDEINTNKSGIFLGYPDPIHGKYPTKHHIYSDWEIICKHTQLDIPKPELKPEIYLELDKIESIKDKIGVQVLHKNQWHSKKVWDKFKDLCEFDSEMFVPIPKTKNLHELVNLISSYKMVVCAEGAVSHIAKAVNTPAIVIFGGFANPMWNGYEDQINITNVLECSYCYNPRRCINNINKLCMQNITIDDVVLKAKEFVQYY